MRSSVVLASTAKSSPQTISFNEIGRQAIMSDPAFAGGNYYSKKKKPDIGLAIARMVGHITYLSEKGLEKKFGRKLQDKARPDFSFGTEFEVESYLKYKSRKFIERFDANSYLYITRAMDYFDPAGKKSLSTVLSKAQSRFLVVSFTSDWLYPPTESMKIVQALNLAGKNVSYYNIEADYGHDSFLVKTKTLAQIVRRFLASVQKGV
jgi:homoserine O-acetyltransferase